MEDSVQHPTAKFGVRLLRGDCDDWGRQRRVIEPPAYRSARTYHCGCWLLLNPWDRVCPPTGRRCVGPRQPSELRRILLARQTSLCASTIANFVKSGAVRRMVGCLAWSRFLVCGSVVRGTENRRRDSTGSSTFAPQGEQEADEH